MVEENGNSGEDRAAFEFGFDRPGDRNPEDIRRLREAVQSSDTCSQAVKALKRDAEIDEIARYHCVEMFLRDVAKSGMYLDSKAKTLEQAMLLQEYMHFTDVDREYFHRVEMGEVSAELVDQLYREKLSEAHKILRA